MDTLQIGLAIVAAAFAAAVTFTKANSSPVDPSSGISAIVAGEHLQQHQSPVAARQQISSGRDGSSSGGIDVQTDKAVERGMHGEPLTQMASQAFAVGFRD
jgi:hypothetical protein